MEATRDLAPNVTLDTSAVITAFEPAREGHSSMRHLIEASQAGRVRLVVSQRTLDELREKSDEKLAFAESLEVLPYHMIGTWNDFDPSVTWDDPLAVTLAHHSSLTGPTLAALCLHIQRCLRKILHGEWDAATWQQIEPEIPTGRWQGR